MQQHDKPIDAFDEMQERAALKAEREAEHAALFAAYGGAGQFRIALPLRVGNAAALAAVLEGFIPMSVEQEFHRNTILLRGYHKKWPHVPQGLEAPTYAPTITSHENGTYSVSWEAA